MADSRFFRRSGPHALSAIAALTGAEVQGRGADPARPVQDVAALDAAGPQDVSFLDNVKYLPAFRASRAAACFVRAKFAAQVPLGMTLLVCDDPYGAFALTARLFYPEAPVSPGISAHARVDATAEIGEGTCVEAGAVIGAQARLGRRCHIGTNAVIHDGVVIGDDTRIGACSTVSHSVIGERVIIHRGVHIGQDGFGFAPTQGGILKVPQLGRVVIGHDVEIGSGTCIDRGAGPDTVIGDGCKIDNLVQIGHNCRIGRSVIIVAQVGIAGSTRVEDGVMLGGQAGIGGHVTIGRGAKVAAQSGVMRDIPPGEAHGGSPSVPVRDWHRQQVALGKLIKSKEADHD